MNRAWRPTEPHIAWKGDMDSIMAGLSCGVPNPISWEIIRNFADGFFSCSDVLPANGMRILGNPLADDPRVVAGESGAVGIGLIDEIMKHRSGHRGADRAERCVPRGHVQHGGRYGYEELP